MGLDQADKDWFTTQFTSELGKMETKLSNSIATLGKRVLRVEHAYGVMSRLAKTVAVENAKKNHARLLQQMFDGSDILAVPTLVEDNNGRKVRGSMSCSYEDAKRLVEEFDDDYDTELAPKIGFRFVHNSRSAQKRRKAGAKLIKDLKETAKNLGLHLQYDKPFELRGIQGKAQKFLATLKREGKNTVSSTQARGGYLMANDVRLAPEYLVPEMHRWSALIEHILSRIRAWGRSPPLGPEEGVMFDVFASEYVAELGIVDLSDITVDGESMQY